MRKLKQILAGFLAMNLTISVTSTGMINVRASEEYSSEGVYEDLYTEESVQTYAEETAGSEQIVSETDAVYSSSNISVEEEVSENSTPIAENTTVTENTTAIESTAPVESTTAVVTSEEVNQTENQATIESSIETSSETTSESLSDSDQSIENTSNMETTENVTEDASEEESSSEEEQTQEEESSQEDQSARVVEYITPEKLVPSQFKNYTDTDGVKTVTVKTVKELILLSNCDPKELQDITIYISITGQANLTEKSAFNIKEGDDLSDIIKVESSTSEIQQENGTTVSDSQDAQTEAETNSEQNDDEQDNEQGNDNEQVESITAGQDYTFQSIGTVAFPFRGEIKGEKIQLNIDKTFFDVLSSCAKTNDVSLGWCSDGTKPIVAQIYKFESASTTDNESDNSKNHDLSVKVSWGSGATAMGSLIGEVTADDDYDCKDDILNIGNVIDYKNATVAVSSTGNAGLICNTLSKGNIRLNGYTFPTGNYNVIASNTSAVTNAGGVIGVMKNNTALYIKSNINITTGTDTETNEKIATQINATGNAGGLIGMMEEGAKLEVETGVTITLTEPDVTGNISAGGLVGTMQKNAKIVTGSDSSVILTTSSVTGSTSVGGVVGEAEDVTFADSDIVSSITVKNATLTGDASAVSVGGFIGTYTLDAANLGEEASGLKLPDQMMIEAPVLKVTQDDWTGVVGGYFGYLNIKGTVTYAIEGINEKNKKSINPTYNVNNVESCGAVAGQVVSDKIESTLLIQNIDVSATNNNGENIASYHGGLIGKVGGESSQAVYLEVSNVNINVINPSARDEEQKGFGGIAGFLAPESILKAMNAITISTSDSNGTACATLINRGGGLVGYADRSVINLSGTTDLSGVGYVGGNGKIVNNPKTGWLVGKQESALIYANGDGNGNGWSYIRGKENTSGTQAMNDIGNYGQIIRLQSSQNATSTESKLSWNLIKINESTHEIEYTPTTNVEVDTSSKTITIGSVDAFALVSIAWNTRGNFGGIQGISAEKFNTDSPKSKNIMLTADIDLTGSGITGLSRDAYDAQDADTYIGIFDGKGNTIKLSSGETFGYNLDGKTLAEDGKDGYGKVVSAKAKYHGRQGLFAAVGTSATIKDLTIDGKINVSNAGRDILAGGIAGEITENGNPDITLTGVTVKETIIADCPSSEYLMVGGFFGGSYGSGKLKLEGNSRAEATINLKNCTADDQEINAGGVIGEVGEKPFTFNAEDLTISGSITTDAKKRAYVGGLIGVIKGNGSITQKNEAHGINIENMIFNNFKIDAENAVEVCGGLFGSIWDDVGVYFGKDTNAGITVRNGSEIKAPKAAYVGGLVYRSSGKWEIRENGIDLVSLNITAGNNVGLLVCKGEKEEDLISSGKIAHGALYLSTTKHWDTSYQINEDDVSISTTNADGVFDEFVAYTASEAKNIIENDINGVVSIATQDSTDSTDGRVGVDVSTCTTYQNRTAYGKSHKTNACSRYYYDLDQCLKYSKEHTNEKIDTPQELLLWSVYNYACNNIKGYFTDNTDIQTPEENNPWVIGDTEQIDMSKYSYYPIKYNSESVTIQNTEIIFNNEGIENIEKDATNKSTQDTTDFTEGLDQTGSQAELHTQHYMMHCGLFLTYRSGALDVNEVTFSGSIGKVNNSTSGVLVADLASGGKDGSATYFVRINIKDIILNGLKVNNCENDYAPLLINGIGHWKHDDYTYGYVALSVTGVTVNEEQYKMGTPAASSLIGYVGSDKAREITMSFLNIKLPDKKANGTTGIFSHATLLERFAYADDDNASVGTYNFNLNEDWDGEDHVYNVTYGKEITETIEFEGLQRWYYDEELNGKPDDGYVYDDVANKNGLFDASKYLPYVCTAYDADNSTHEIKVNQRVTDILEGCGTYGHPYKITKAREMEVLAEYMASGKARKEWRVKITQNQSTVHTANSSTDYTSDSDIIYEYDGVNSWKQVEKENGNWVKVDGGITLSNDFMRDYLLNAYYDIQGTVTSSDNGTTEVTTAEDISESEPTLTLTNFKGFGTSTNPFRGVITSKNDTNIILEGSQVGNGLIPYSYGSVVKGLTITYKGSKTLTYSKTAYYYYPSVCFGGVIGCVLGGDNIIDGVTVNIKKDEWLLTLSGEQNYLIQVGGYVGSISGGGVIFRNMDGKSGLTDDVLVGGSVAAGAYSSLYVNPYVGRVLDGFAFYEADSTTKILDNTSKNYKINTIVANANTNYVNISGNTVTVEDAQGLLILSALINSGAASNGISNAYSRMGSAYGQKVQYTVSSTTGTIMYSFGGKYGKVRSALYNNIGEIDAIKEDSTDAKLSISEDRELPEEGNLPYLIKKYCNNASGLFGISINPDLEIVLNNQKDRFDMANYENGYQGIGARYVSNAVQGYADTDNGIINYPECVIPEINSFNGNSKNVTVHMQVREYADDDFHAASVGGIFNILQVKNNGNISNLTIDQNGAEVPVTPEVSLTYYKSNGQPMDAAWTRRDAVGVGGVVGSLVGYTDVNTNCDITIENIQLGNLTVISPASAGGVFGNTGKPIDVPETEKIDKKKINDIIVLLQPKDSQIAYGIAFNACSYTDLTVTGKYAAGGFVGYIGNKEQNPRSSVNGNGFTGTLTSSQSQFGQNSIISATDNSAWAGGLFGYVGTRMFINMTDTGTKTDNQITLEGVIVSAGTAVGGCIGYIDGKCYGIHNVTVQKKENNNLISLPNKTETQTGTFYAGGIVGYAKGEGQNWTEDWIYAGGFSKCIVENMQINDVNKANAHDYPSSASEIKTNYIAGGIVGQVAGGNTQIEECTINSSDVYGSIAGGITGRTDSLMQFVNCNVRGASDPLKLQVKGFSTAGGILGFWMGGKAVTIQSCNVQFLNIEAKDWGVSALIGDAANGGAGNLYLFDSSAKDSSVTATGNKDSAGGRWPSVGGIIGNLRNDIKASNVLFSNITLEATRGSISQATTGLLFGNRVGGNISIAGISIQNIPDVNKNWETGAGNNGYIAFADYSGSASNSSLVGNSNNLLGYHDKTEEVKTEEIKVDIESPYVVTSPKSTLSVYDSKATTDNNKIKYLYGDSVLWSSKTVDGKETFSVKAQEIWGTRKNATNVTEDHHFAYKNVDYAYKNTDSEMTFDFGTVISSYNENQTVMIDEDKNFPVIRLSSGDAGVVTDYLDIVTNGAFTAANNKNTATEQHVTATAEVYNYDSDKKAFVKAEDSDNNKVSPAFTVRTNAKNQLIFATTTDYDNDKNRFTLLTVTFKEKDADGKEHNYNVFVPILVRRMLEIDFTATLTYGTDFDMTSYTNLENHVLESFGSSITGYLTYTYDSELGKYTDYGWQSYIDAGGNLMDMKKTIKFVMDTESFPKGTQFTLVNADSKKVYYYTATGKEDYETGGNNGIVIPLSSFKDSSNQPYQEPSISELIHATATTEGDGSKLFVKVDKDGKPENPDKDKTYLTPTIRIKNSEGKYEYYRLAIDGETGTHSITVQESSLKKEEKDKTITSTVSENYYLVITVPSGSVSEALNGSIWTTITTSIPKNIHYRDRKTGGEDDHGNSASTYQLSNGYQQRLTQNQDDKVSKKIVTADTKMTVNVIDEITFPNSQSYNDYDQLYLRFVGGLQKTVKNAEEKTITSAEQFPSGTTGTANFYVYTESNGVKTYYGWRYAESEKKWKWSKIGTSEVAISYTWTSDDGTMELPLGTGQQVADLVSLQDLRDAIVLNTDKKGNSSIFVELSLIATLPVSGLDAIPETQIGTNGSLTEYTKLTCTSQLSTVTQSLAYSNNRASVEDMRTAYYRDLPSGAKLTYDADVIDQLGINLLDLQSSYLDVAKQNSLIDTTAIYDLSSMKNLESTLKSSSGIKFTLTLCQKNADSDQESYGSILSNASSYLTVELEGEGTDKFNFGYDNNGTWSWIVPQEVYYDTAAKQLKTEGIFDGTKLTQLILLKVNVKNTNIYYSNYKVSLTAEILDSKGIRVPDTDLNDNIIYTFAKINPEFVDPDAGK